MPSNLVYNPILPPAGNNPSLHLYKAVGYTQFNLTPQVKLWLQMGLKVCYRHTYEKPHGFWFWLE